MAASSGHSSRSNARASGDVDEMVDALSCGAQLRSTGSAALADEPGADPKVRARMAAKSALVLIRLALMSVVFLAARMVP